MRLFPFHRRRAACSGSAAERARRGGRVGELKDILMFGVDAEVRDRVQATLGHTFVVEQLVEGSSNSGIGSLSLNRAQNSAESIGKRLTTIALFP